MNLVKLVSKTRKNKKDALTIASTGTFYCTYYFHWTKRPDTFQVIANPISAMTKKKLSIVVTIN